MTLMNHEAGLQALKDGDLKTAVPLLAEAVQEADYSSEALNDAYTQALYRAGDKTRLAYAAIEIGDALLEKNPCVTSAISMRVGQLPKLLLPRETSSL